MKILFVEPYEFTFIHFRKELLDALIHEGYEVVLCIQKTKHLETLYSDKLKIRNVPIDLKSKNIFSNLSLQNKYKKIIKSENPDLILSFTIKPNLYCAKYSKHIPIITNITGLGTLFDKDNFLKKIGIFLYRKSFKNVDYVFFQNSNGLKTFRENNIPLNNYKIIPGSGVNLDRYPYSPYKRNDNETVNFLYASRAIEEKGFNILVNAIPAVVSSNKNVHFNFLININDVTNNNPAREILKKYEKYVSILGTVTDPIETYKNNSFVVAPSFYNEGISNVLLESLSCGRPVITTNDNPGCMEVLNGGSNGFGVKSRDLPSLEEALIRASNTPHKVIVEMGKNGRSFVENNFDRRFVVNEYLETIKEFSSSYNK